MTMKSLCFCVLLLAALSAQGQEMTLRRGNETIPVTWNQSTSMGALQIDGVEYYIVRRSEVDTAGKNLKQARIDNSRLVAILAAKETVLTRYDVYKSAADDYARTLESAHHKADSLYRDYKSLYTDLKKIVGISSYGLGVGLAASTFESQSLKPNLALSAYWHDFEVLYHFGFGYQSIVATYRPPLPF